MVHFLLKSFVALLILIVVGWCYGLYHYLEIIAHYPITDIKADGIVIFTGGRGRIDQGLELLKIYPQTPVLVSGVGHDLYSLPMAKNISKEYMGDITLGRDALNTIGNAKETKKWMLGKGIKSVRLVTSHYHMPRSLLLLQKEMPGSLIIPHPIISDTFQSDGWWNNKKLYKRVIAEYNKFLIISIQQFLGF